MAAGIGQARYLERLFCRLSTGKVRYAVMRNYESLPKSTCGSDLDILSSGEDFFAAQKAVRDAAREVGAVIIGEIRGKWFYQAHVLGMGGRAGGWGCRVDLYPGINFKGHEIASVNWATDTVGFSRFTALERQLGLLIGVVKSMLSHGELPDRYRVPITTLGRDQPICVENWLAPLGPKARLMVMEALPHSHLQSTTTNIRRRIRRAARGHQFFERPGRYVLDAASWQLGKVRRFLHPSGVVVAVLGVDGVGKSTVIDGVLPALREATHRACEVQHLRPGLLPPLSRLKGRRHVQEGPVVDPHGSRPSGTFGSLGRVAWLLVDYLLGYWLRVRPFVAKQPGIFLFDRYAYDMALDPQRFRIGLSPRVLSWFARLAPRPDLIICLYASPSVILGRKQELPEGEVRRQLDALRAFAARNPRAVMVSTEGGPEAVRNRVLQVLFDFFGSRDRARRARSDAA